MGKEQIKVEYIDHMGSDLSTVNSARVSFDKQVDEVSGGDVKLIKYLAKHKHMTPFRHNQIQIRCNAPIFIARQLGKHQAGLSWNEVSRRYVDSEPELFMPDEWRLKPEGSIKQGSSAKAHVEKSFVIEENYWDSYNDGPLEDVLGTALDAYRLLMVNSLDLYSEMVEQNIAPEMARMVLPQSMMTSWYWTGNLISFAHVYKERIAEGAQLEAQWFAEDLDKVIRPLFPESWSALVDG